MKTKHEATRGALAKIHADNPTLLVFTPTLPVFTGTGNRRDDPPGGPQPRTSSPRWLLHPSNQLRRPSSSETRNTNNHRRGPLLVRPGSRVWERHRTPTRTTRVTPTSRNRRLGVHGPGPQHGARGQIPPATGGKLGGQPRLGRPERDSFLGRPRGGGGIPDSTPAHTPGKKHRQYTPAPVGSY